MDAKAGEKFGISTGIYIFLSCKFVAQTCNKILGGAVAQLGARLNGIQKVRGSNPLSSTNKFKEFQALDTFRFPATVVKL